MSLIISMEGMDCDFHSLAMECLVAKRIWVTTVQKLKGISVIPIFRIARLFVRETLMPVTLEMKSNTFGQSPESLLQDHKMWYKVPI